MGQFNQSFLSKAINTQQQGTVTDSLGRTNQSKIPRGSSVVERWTHNPEVEGETPSPATIPPNIILGYN